jgi:3-hydroxyisobutyrate dehydrogenase-like beta-hydroxyacid dehydrogenase
METIAVLGTGLIGAGFVTAARKRGLDVVVWNRTLAKAEALVSHGARLAKTPGEATKGASRVHIAVSDDAAVEEVLASVLPALAKDAIVIDHSTTSPKGNQARFARAAKEGFSFLHAPVFMSPSMAHSAKGLMLCAGPEAVYAKAKDALAAMTGEVMYLGERPDLAAAYKLFGNAMIITIVGGLSDVFAMAKHLDLEPGLAHQLFAKFKPGGTIDFRGAKMAAGDYTPSFEMTMARKDVRLMIEAAGDEALCVLPGIAARMDSLIASGYGAEDLSALSRDSVPPKKSLAHRGHHATGT